MKLYAILAVAACLVASAVGFVYFTRQNAPADGYLNVRLGMNMAKVFYAIGTPKTVSDPDDSLRRSGNTSTDEVNAADLDQEARSHYLDWTYGKSGYVSIRFDPETKGVKKITCIDFRGTDWGTGYPDNDPTCPSLGGVSTGMEENKVVQVLGKPSTEIENPNAKIVTYRRQAIAIMYRQNKVVSLSLDQDAK